MLQLHNAPGVLSPSVDLAFRDDVLCGLSGRPRAISPRWLYDRRGSELFEAITELPEYYPSRTERSILSRAANEIATLVGPGRALVEFGSGSSSKTEVLLSTLSPAAYVPIDISSEFLKDSASRLSAKFPYLPILPLAADFTRPLTLPNQVPASPRLGFFPGSTIGNLTVPVAVNLLRAMTATLKPGALLLIGIDRTKDPSILLPAYADAAGITAAFNLNLLHRINRELTGSIPVEAFRHLARWNQSEKRIEMHLEAMMNVRFTIEGEVFSMVAGETIHTENSSKYSLHGARLLLRAGGWTAIADWTDENEWFSVILARAEGAKPLPYLR